MAAQSVNRLQSKGGHRWAYRKVATQALVLVEDAKARLGIPAAEGKRRVTFERVWGPGQRAYDRDNLVGGMKPIRDALTKAGLLVDDAEKWCQAHYGQRGPEPTATIIVTLEELG
jgi:Holliday junction resolvase RusA-like endonuclease